jgi:cobalamin biosynthesis Mg chelatase CobN
LQGEQKQLQAAMTQLSSQLLAREQRRAANQTQSTAWLVGLVALAALAALAGAGVWIWKRRAAARRG